MALKVSAYTPVTPPTLPGSELLYLREELRRLQTVLQNYKEVLEALVQNAGL